MLHGSWDSRRRHRSRVSRSASASPASDRTTRDSRVFRWRASAALRRCRPASWKTHRCSPTRKRMQPAPALVGLVRRLGALFRDAGDDEFAGLEAAFAGHGGQFVTQ